MTALYWIFYTNSSRLPILGFVCWKLILYSIWSAYTNLLLNSQTQMINADLIIKMVDIIKFSLYFAPFQMVFEHYDQFWMPLKSINWKIQFDLLFNFNQYPPFNEITSRVDFCIWYLRIIDCSIFKKKILICYQIFW